MLSDLTTTRPVKDVSTIADIEAIESQPYDTVVTARNLYDLFRATTAHAGDHKALTVLRSEDPVDVGATFTHSELLVEITRAANMFRAMGLRDGEGVAAFLTPTLPELPALLFGAQVAGIASSLNYLLSRDAIFDLLNAQAATILVVPARHLDETCWSKVDGVFDHVPSLRQVVVLGGEVQGDARYVGLAEAIHDCQGDALDFAPTTDRDTVCGMFHTGGTTGRPKIVQLTHGNQIHAAFGFGQIFAYDETDVVINGFPFFHVGGTMTVGLSVLSAGGHVVVPSAYALRPPEVVQNYWNIVRHFKATVVDGVPTSIAAITNSWPQDMDGSTIRMALTGGAVCPKAVSSRFQSATGIPLYETYGMTEAAAAIAISPARGNPVAGSVGFRIPYSEIRVIRLDPDNPGLCAPNESGAVQVRGPQIFPGYLDPGHNIGTLDDEGWLITGDVGYLTDDQRLVLTGREKDLIVRSGHNIDPASIEDVANGFAGVAISAAVGMPDQYAGEVPILFVVPEPGVNLDLDALKAYLATEVTERPAYPKSVLLIEALPVTAVGKIFKPVLRDLAIKEKIRLETVDTCGTGTVTEIDIRLDDHKNTLVDIRVFGADAKGIAELSERLEALPQTYSVQAGTKPTGSDLVLLDRKDAIAILTLNRPDSLNALNQEMTRALKARLQELANQNDVRVVVITATGRAFSAGGDLIEFEQALNSGETVLLEYLTYNQEILQMVEDIPVPVIAAVNGTAIAGGMELVLCCDIVIAAETAKLGDGHSRFGVVPAGGATVRLAERVSPSRAAQLFYTAAVHPASAFAEWGLVNEVVASDKLFDRAIEMAQEISRRSPEAIAHIKSLIQRGRAPGRQERMDAEIRAFGQHVHGEDLKKGLAAFRAKKVMEY